MLDDIDIKDLYKNAEDYHTVYYESSRGCPFRCSYCVSGIDNEKVRFKNAGTVLGDLEFIENKYYGCENSKINIIKFCDRTFNFDIKRANELYKGLIERANVYINGYGKKLLPYQFEINPALFDEESFEILQNAPVDLFHMETGIQSLNPQTLEAIGRKNFSVNSALENIARIKNFGNIPIHADLIAGLPYEDLKSFTAGFNLLYEKTKADFIQTGFLKMLRGTKIRAEAKTHGYIYEDFAPYTVLCNNYMSFEDISFLRDAEKMYSRYFSKTYAKSSIYIHDSVFKSDIFGIFGHLAKYWRKNGLFEKPVSQRSAFEAFFYAFGGGVRLAELLEEDFYNHEGKRLKFVYNAQ